MERDDDYWYFVGVVGVAAIVSLLDNMDCKGQARYKVTTCNTC